MGSWIERRHGVIVQPSRRPHQREIEMTDDNLVITDRDLARVAALRPGGQLEEDLERAIVVPPDAVPASVVTMHSRVQYLDESTGERREIQIVYPEQADLAEGRISVLAPVGAALLGLSVGQAIEWKFPGGQMRRLRVQALLFQPESYFSERGGRVPGPASSATDDADRAERARG
jgi:regulator of nucleoside diphosphate kinase